MAWLKLEDESGKLRKIVADLSLDNEMLHQSVDWQNTSSEIWCEFQLDCDWQHPQQTWPSGRYRTAKRTRLRY